MKLSFSKKSHFGENPANSSRIPFFYFCQKFNSLMSFFTLKLVHDNAFYDSVELACLCKVWFVSYAWKCSQQNSYRIITGFFDHQNFWKESNDILEFLDEDKWRQHLSLLLLVRCGQMSFLSNQILGFFHHQYLSFFCMEVVINER